MPTASDIITRAYRKIRVVAVDEPMTADQAVEGLAACNMMMHGWEAHGVNIGHTDMALTDEFPMPDQFHEAAIYLLANTLAPDYARPAVAGSNPMRRLQAFYMEIPNSAMPVDFFKRRGRIAL